MAEELSLSFQRDYLIHSWSPARHHHSESHNKWIKDIPVSAI